MNTAVRVQHEVGIGPDELGWIQHVLGNVDASGWTQAERDLHQQNIAFAYGQGMLTEHGAYVGTVVSNRHQPIPTKDAVSSDV